MNDGDLGFAVVDHDRPRRCGFPEVVLCAGKQSEQVVAIAREVFARSRRVLLTRCDAAQAAAVQVALPAARHHERARCLTIDPEPLPKVGRAAIVVAGTSDLPVAEEARVTLDVMGIGHELFADVGVAGLHRLLARIDAIRSADVVRRRHGRGAAVGRRRPRRPRGHRRADQRRLRRELRRARGAADDDERLRGWRRSRQH
jgi:hypothetical protein